MRPMLRTLTLQPTSDRKPATDWQPCKPKPLVATRDMRRIARGPHSPWGRQDRYLENPNARRPR